MKKPVRIADKLIYNNSAQHEKPKEYFKLIQEYIENGKTIIDVGCANGALLNFLDKKNNILIGIEPVKALVKSGQVLNKNILFYNSDLNNFNPNDLIQKADYVVSAGVIGIFENPELFIKKLIKLCKPKGKILIFSPFNEENIDVILQYKYSGSSTWEKGHNLYSLTTMVEIAKKYNYSIEVIDFNMNKKIPKSNDPMRSWTEQFRGKKHHLIYGTNMFSTMKLLILNKLSK